MTPPDAIVFVVDDDPAICEAVKRLIGSVGLRVETFGSTREFLAVKRPDAPACLVLDVRLPDVSGWNFNGSWPTLTCQFRLSSSPAMPTFR
jgi:FixJ family two-component response regulator